jgi:outer membrane immunogenic protein
MKKFLLASTIAAFLAGPAMAADMPVKAPAGAVAISSWSGWYFGVNAGWGWGREKFRDVIEDDFSGVSFHYGDFSYRTDGFVGGFQTGYNWQLGQFVLGYESDTQLTTVRGDTRFERSIFDLFPSATFHTDVSSKLLYFGTARLRAGYLVTPALLAYATGGLAYGRTKSTLSFVSVATGANPFTASDERTSWGWSAGSGLEGKLSDRLSWKAEYLFVHLRGKDHHFLIAGDNYHWHQRTDLHVARVGLNVLLFPAGGVGP